MKRIATVFAAILLVTCGAFAEGANEGDSFTLRGIDSISIRAGTLDVQVLGTDADDVTLTADLPSGFLFSGPGYRVVHERRGARLSIWVQSDSPFGITGGGKLRVRVPRNDVVLVQTLSGSILVDGLDNESCTLSAVSGGLTVRDTHSRLSLDNVSGSIILDSTDGSLRVKTVSGSIEGKRLAVTGNSSFNSVSGSVTVRLDESLDDFRFDLATVSGRVSVGTIRAERGLRMGDGDILIQGHTVSGALLFR
jgi:Putative adhesin